MPTESGFLSEFVRNIKYVVVHNSRVLNFAQLAQKCQEKGGKLASIRDAREQILAARVVKASRKRTVLTGMKRVNGRSKTFVDTYGLTQKYT